MKSNSESFAKLLPILLGIGGIFYLINQLFFNGWYTWNYYTSTGEAGHYSLFEVIQRNPLIGLAILIIPISVFLYYLVDNRIKNGKYKSNVLKSVLLWILDIFVAVFDVVILFVMYS